jgi:subtilase family serine protease
VEPRSTTAAAAVTTAPTGSANAAAGSTPVIISPTPGTQIRATSAPGRAISPAPRPVHEPASSAEELLHRDAVPTTQECISLLKVPCYEPAQVRAAYNVDGLIRNGIDGTGQTVVIIVSFGSPTLKEDLAAFSNAMGLPDADLIELYPLGTDFKEIDPADTRGWAGETTLDAEWVHGIAPGARIVVLASPVSETEGVDGMPEFLALERYAVDNKLGSVISQSWGTSENLLDDSDGAAMRADFDAFYQQAGRKGVTIVTASGDHGPLADTLSGGVATVRSADWPAGVPWITVVGGTMLRLNPNGSYGSETVLDSSSVASGSGISIFYDQPAEQSVLPPSFQKLLNGKRGEADVAALGAGLLLYFAATPDRGAHPGVSGGTSASAPIWAAIVALANQAAGKGLGNINPALYQLGSSGKCFHDVTQGTNRFRNDPGEPALAGWDFPTGWGSPDAGCLVPALAAATKGS